MTLDTYEGHEGAFEKWRQEAKPAATAANLTISDHAMVRFLERACGVEVDAMRELLAGILSPMIASPNTQFTHNGLRFVVRNGVLVTIYSTTRQAGGAYE